VSVEVNGLAKRAERAAGIVAIAVTYGVLMMTGALPGLLRWRDGMEVGKTPLYKQATVPVERRVEDLLRRMTAEEKVRQLDMYAGATGVMDTHTDETHAGANARFVPAKAEALWGSLGVGSVHDLNATPAQYNVMQRWIVAHSRLGIPALFLEEALHGSDTGTVFPTPLNLASTWDTELARETAAAIAAEARAKGVGMILAPVLDLAREPRWGRVEEDFGEDPYLTGQMGLAYTRGAQGDSLSSDHTVVNEPKHFAAHGSPEGGSNTSPVPMGERELRTMMLRGFEPAIREGHAMATMAAYHEIDGVPVTADSLLLKGLLRGEWGFDGMVLSDLGAIERLYTVHHVAATKKEAACLAIRSGVDMQFYDFPHEVFQGALLACVREGTLPEMEMDRAVRAVLRLKFRLGLFERPTVDEGMEARVYRSPEHLAVSLRSARESMTLLKNEGGVLPLSKALRRIAVIGPNGDVARYGDYEKEANGLRISVLDGVRTLLPKAAVTFAKGGDVAAAVAKARTAEVVILVMGERQGISGEGFDRTELGLPGGQEELMEAVVATGRPVVLVLENGRPLTIPWAKTHVPAILEAWYPGEYGGQAVAETVFGDMNPSGKLTITFPANVGQLPDFYNADPSRSRTYVDDDGKPLFPFGYGLSYTSFRYSGLTVQVPANGSKDDVTVAVSVTNTGAREGTEVAQLYLREDVSSVETPARWLAGFARVGLKAGESRVVRFRVRQQQMAVWSLERRWVVEAGRYTAWVGGSSEAEMEAHFEMRP